MSNNKWDCKTCYHWYHDGTCDMCCYGYPYSIDNNGLKPEQVKDCNAYVQEKGKLNATTICKHITNS